MTDTAVPEIQPPGVGRAAAAVAGLSGLVGVGGVVAVHRLFRSVAGRLGIDHINTHGETVSRGILPTGHPFLTAATFVAALRATEHPSVRLIALDELLAHRLARVAGPGGRTAGHLAEILPLVARAFGIGRH